MNDPLQKFISENRAEFDSEMPDPALIQKIGPFRPEPARRRIPFTRFWKPVAAAACLLLLAGIIFWLPRTGTAKGAGESKKVTIAGTDPLFSNQISQFRQVINLQQEELENIRETEPRLYQQFTRDLQILDSSYRELSATLASTPNRETILEAMIGNLRLQSELLTRQLMIIRNIKQNKSHEKTRI